MKTSSLFFLLAFVLISCDNPDEFRGEKKEVTAAAGQEVSFTRPQGKIKITEISDGRCPMDVTCIWQGKATVKFELHTGDDLGIGTVHLSGIKEYPPTTEVRVNNRKFRVTIKDITPYPCANCPERPASQAVLEIEPL